MRVCVRGDTADGDDVVIDTVITKNDDFESEEFDDEQPLLNRLLLSLSVFFNVEKKK